MQNSEPVEIRKSLVLSTAHLRAETAAEWDNNTAEGCSSGVSVPYGYSHYAHPPDSDGNEDFPDDIEPEVKEACWFAHKHGCICMRTRSSRQPHMIPLDELLSMSTVSERFPDIATRADMRGGAGTDEIEAMWEEDPVSGKMAPPPAAEGADDLMNAELLTYTGCTVTGTKPLQLSRETWERIQRGDDIYTIDELPTLGSNQTVRLIGDDYSA